MVYDITSKSGTIGRARVEQQNLYYRIHCRCDLPDGEFYRITVRGSRGTVNLGTCVPEQGAYQIHTSVPIKYLGTDSLKFRIDEKREQFIPIRENEPFSYLTRLPECRLTYENGKPGIELTPA